MDILYEGAVFEIMRCGGVARYFTELINRLPADSVPTVLGPIKPPDGITHPNYVYQGLQTQPPVKWLRKAWRPVLQSRIGKRIQQTKVDLVHWTYYSGLCKRAIQESHRPTVITLYDFIHETYPESDPGGKHSHVKQQAIQVADRICCISQATYDDLCNRHPSAASRACVTPLGSGLESVIPASLPTQLANRNYLLFVGRRDSYKNFDSLWQAWNRVQCRIPDTSLVLVGPQLKPRERAALRWDEDSDRCHLFADADDSLLRCLYQNCQAFVFPSKMEGFGLPILEAMINDAPVIASTCDAFQEIAGDAAYFFEASDVDTLSDLLIAAGRQSLPERDAKLAEGRRQASLFTWENTAAKTVKVYQSMIDNTNQRRAA